MVGFILLVFIRLAHNLLLLVLQRFISVNICKCGHGKRLKTDFYDTLKQAIDRAVTNSRLCV